MTVQADIQVQDHILAVTLIGEFDGKIPSEARFGRLAQTCADQQLQKLLVNVSGLMGKLGTMAKMQLGMEFAQAFRNTDIKIAIIGNDAILEARRFFEMVAQGHHDRIAVFKDLPAAQTWLQREQGSAVSGG